MLAQPVNESVARGFDEKGSQMSDIGEAPAGLAESVQQIGPNRLHHIDRVELGPKSGRQLSPNHHAQIWLIGQEGLFDHSRVAAFQLGK